MKLSTQFIALAGLSTATAVSLDPRTSTADGYVISYTPPDCVEAAGTNVTNALHTDLELNNCVNIPLFTSFKGGLSNGCPEGETPTITVYGLAGCQGSSVSAGVLPTSFESGSCVESLLGVDGKGVSVGSTSAEFTCA